MRNEVRAFWINVFNKEEDVESNEKYIFNFARLIRESLSNELRLVGREEFEKHFRKFYQEKDIFSHIIRYKIAVNEFFDKMEELSQHASFISLNDLFSVSTKFRTLILNYLDSEYILDKIKQIDPGTFVELRVLNASCEQKERPKEKVRVSAISEEEYSTETQLESEVKPNFVVKTWNNLFVSGACLIFSIIIGTFLLPGFLTSFLDAFYSDPQYLENVTSFSNAFFESHSEAIGFHQFDLFFLVEYALSLFHFTFIIMWSAYWLSYLLISNLLLKRKNRKKLLVYRLIATPFFAFASLYFGAIACDVFKWFDYNDFIIQFAGAVPTIDDVLAFFYNLNYYLALCAGIYFVLEIVPIIFLANEVEGNSGSYPVRVVVKNKEVIDFNPTEKFNQTHLELLFRKFLFSKFLFHEIELEQVYSEFLRFLKVKKKYRSVSKSFIFDDFKTLITLSLGNHLLHSDINGTYYLTYLQDLGSLSEDFHSVCDSTLASEDISFIIGSTKVELDVLTYYLVHNGHMYYESKESNYLTIDPFLEKLFSDSKIDEVFAIQEEPYVISREIFSELTYNFLKKFILLGKQEFIYGLCYIFDSDRFTSFGNIVTDHLRCCKELIKEKLATVSPKKMHKRPCDLNRDGAKIAKEIIAKGLCQHLNATCRTNNLELFYELFERNIRVE